MFKKLALTALLASSVMAASPVVAKDTIRALSAFPASSGLGSDFVKYIELVNKAGEGVLEIDLVGGPEVAPASEQGTMLANGLIDMLHTPPIYFAGRFPEAEIFAAKLRSSDDIRADGGVEMYDEALGARLKSRLIAFADGDYGLYIMTTKEPQIGANGLPVLDGMKIRGTTIYENLFSELGASSLIIPYGETYTALERGMVDGVGYTLSDVEPAGWTDYLKYFITPRMYGGSMVILMNNDAFDKLSAESKAILTQASLEFETVIKDHYTEKEAVALNRLKELGLTEIKLDETASAAFKSLAVSTYMKKLEANKDNYNIDLHEALKVFSGE